MARVCRDKGTDFVGGFCGQGSEVLHVCGNFGITTSDAQQLIVFRFSNTDCENLKIVIELPINLFSLVVEN